MAIIAEYKALAFGGITPVKDLEMDSNGYRKCIVGAFDIMTRNGQFYPLTARVKAIFEDSSTFMMRVREGCCRGELGHPRIYGMSLPQILDRLAHIEDKNVCVHYRDFILEATKDEYGKTIVIVYAWLKPSGPYASTLEARLNNREENAAFSVRSYTEESVRAGIKQKEITHIVTYDGVECPGVKITTKFDTGVIGSVGLEDLNDYNVMFTKDDLDKAIAAASILSDAGLESNHSRLVHVKDSLGWNKVQCVTPHWLNWKSRL